MPGVARTVSVLTASKGMVELRAEVFGAFAVHATPLKTGYLARAAFSVTHVTTGRALLTEISPREAACDLAARVERAGIAARIERDDPDTFAAVEWIVNMWAIQWNKDAIKITGMIDE